MSTYEAMSETGCLKPGHLVMALADYLEPEEVQFPPEVDEDNRWAQAQMDFKDGGSVIIKVEVQTI